MLTALLKIFKETDRPLDLDNLSRELGIEKTALEGMLQTLVRQGKLKEIVPGSAQCTKCHGRGTCTALQSGYLGTIYELADH